jgi:molybdopterin molybdotransferase
MLDYEEALVRILSVVPPPVLESVKVEDAYNRVLAEEVRSAINLPLFDNSAMDGYAVRAAEVALAKPGAPTRLRLAGRIAAGESFNGEMEPGTCIRVFTGSPLPNGADAVVMQEDTRTDPNEDIIQIIESVKPWENIRFHGEDVKQGSRLGGKGELVTAGRLSLLAAAGTVSVGVGRRPVVGLLATGSELREPGQTLAPGQIHESNRLSLATLASQVGARPMIFPLVADSLTATRSAFEQAFSECDAVVTSGGVSVGELDFVKAALEAIGGNLQFWRVAIKPGRPFVLGRWQRKLLFGLPGNPVSAFVTFLLLVRPALLQWQGANEISLPAHPGVLGEPIANPGSRRHFARVKVDAAGVVSSAGVQASHIMSSLAEANGLVDIPPNTTLAAGTAVRVLRIL